MRTRMRRKGDEFQNEAAPAQPRSPPGGDPKTPNRAAYGSRAEITPSAAGATRPAAGESAAALGHTPGARSGLGSAGRYAGGLCTVLA